MQRRIRWFVLEPTGTQTLFILKKSHRVWIGKFGSSQGLAAAVQVQWVIMFPWGEVVVADGFINHAGFLEFFW